jgi:AcrR family transcriptional regulator
MTRMPDKPQPRFFPWATEPSGGRPTRETLTRDQIVDAGVRILDEEGLDALSMRRLGKELGAGATSLYWHVRNKDELLDLIVDRIIGEVVDELGEPQGWRAWMRAAAPALRRVLLRHRGVAPIMGERPTFGPNAIQALEDVLTALRADGFAPLPALLAATTLVNWASGFAIFEVRDPVGSTASDADREAFVAEMMTFIASLPPERFPTTIELVPVGATISADDQFAYGLDVILDGIEAREARRRAAGVAGEP